MVSTNVREDSGVLAYGVEPVHTHLRILVLALSLRVFHGSLRELMVRWKFEMRNKLLSIALMSLFLACILAYYSFLQPPIPVVAQDPGGPVLTAAAGLDGFAKGGRWLPVRVTLENNGPDIEGILQAEVNGLNNRDLTFAQAVNLPQTSRKEVFLYVYPEAYQSSITVQLLAGGRKVAEVSDRLTSASQADTLYGVVADNATAFNFLSRIKPSNANAFTAYLMPGDLPDHYLGLEPLDVLILSGMDTGALSSAQQEALKGWVMRGGRLLVAGGPDWRKTTAGLKELLPLVPSDESRLETLSALAALIQEEEVPEGEALAAVGELVSGAQVLAQQEEIPLIVQRSYGSGEILFLAVDPALEPLEDWDGLPALFDLLLNSGNSLAVWGSGFQNWDMAHQASSILPDFGLPSAFLVVCFLGIYIVAVGPLNYIILGRLKRRELAWLSIPAIVLVFGGLAWFTGSRSLGNHPLLNRVALVKVWPGYEKAQVEGLVGLFSPRRDRFHIETASGILTHGIGAGINLTQGGRTFILRDEQGNSSTPDLRLDTGGLRSFSVQGEAPAPEIKANLTMTIAMEGIGLKGRVSLPDGFGLQNAVLIAAGSHQGLGDLQPGESREINTRVFSSAQAQQGALDLQYPYYYMPYQESNNLVNSLVGGVDYNQDQQLHHRFMVLNALTNPGYPLMSGWNGGFYLAGWNEEFPLQVGLRNENFRTSGLSLYLIRLEPEIRWESDTALLPPALFTWTSLGSSPGTAASPYDTWVDSAGFSLQFRLAQPFSYSAVESLTLNLPTPGTAQAGLNVKLWDFQEGRWEDLGQLDWGQQTIPSPERYVGPGGEVRMQLSAAGSFGGFQLRRADFSLKVRR